MPIKSIQTALGWYQQEKKAEEKEKKICNSQLNQKKL